MYTHKINKAAAIEYHKFTKDSYDSNDDQWI
jgi:hypothetical protein